MMQIKIQDRIFKIDNSGNINDGKIPVFCKCVKSKLNITQIKRNDKKLQQKAIDVGCNFVYENGKVICRNCGRELEIEKTPEEFEEERLKIEKEKLENLHLVLAGEDWEIGWKMFRLSTRVNTDVWNLIKKYFEYYRKGWSRGQEFEWYGYEPWGWLTTNPKEVEKILNQNGFIKDENTLF